MKTCTCSIIYFNSLAQKYGTLKCTQQHAVISIAFIFPWVGNVKICLDVQNLMAMAHVSERGFRGRGFFSFPTYVLP